MFIVISYTNPEPIFRQIIEQIKTAIALGELPAGEKLPSIRELSAELKVSVITIKRAYSELESEGLIYTRPGLGSFVADLNTESLKNQKLDEMRSDLRKMLRGAKSYGISLDEMIELMKEEAKDHE
ncbi:MAG: GntR family transcriptional regulator [Anaerolineaceae bacterium]|nr:GntR family transcriptional regulator [Anaerolineaceae bacterium]